MASSAHGTRLEEIQRIRNKYGDHKLLECEGAIGVDVDYKRVKGEKTDTPSIVVYVKQKLPRKELTGEAVPTEIEGVPTDIVECPNVWPSPEIFESFGEHVTKVTPEWRPQPIISSSYLQGGQSISNQYQLDGFGTLGIIKARRGGVALSCAHVMVSSLPGIGQAVVEPGGYWGGRYPQDSIGVVSKAAYGGVQNIDAAVVPIEGRMMVVEYVDEIGHIDKHADPAVSQVVKKMGARTGLTKGEIRSTTLTWRYTVPHLGRVTLENQILVEYVDRYGDFDRHGYFALPGDSGAAVITDIHGQLCMVGMVVSGTYEHRPYFTVCNPIGDLRKLL